MIGIAETVIGVVGKVLDKFVADKDKRDELKAAITMAMVESKNEITKIASENVKAEITGHSWMQRNWRPLLMMVIITIVANNFLLAPYIEIFSGKSVYLELPNHLYELMVIGVGGYTIGRSGEKIITKWNQDK